MMGLPPAVFLLALTAAGSRRPHQCSELSWTR